MLLLYACLVSNLSREISNSSFLTRYKRYLGSFRILEVKQLNMKRNLDKFVNLLNTQGNSDAYILCPPSYISVIIN